MSQICPDIIAFPESPAEYPDRWVLMNTLTRQCLGVGAEVLTLLGRGNGEVAGACDEVESYRIWNVWRFSTMDGLLADPSRFRRDAGTWGDPERRSRFDAVALLKEHCLLIDDLVEYRSRFGLKNSLLDRKKFGNYHQQLGQQLLAVERKDPGNWWVQQKFISDLRGIRKDNLYGAVQDRFLDQWLPSRIKPGMRVLDLGCGVGLIANKMARMGASVVGVDPNPEYIRLARERAEGDATFEVMDLNRDGALDQLEAGGFDAVYMSDALLFYFVPYDAAKPLNVDAFVAGLRRILKPGGLFLSLEPHPVFYVLPWLGDAEHPFTIVNEYMNTHWRINPPLSVLTRPFLKGGFVIIGIEEPRSLRDDPHVDRRAAAFANEFPVWLLVEMKKSEDA